MSSEIKSHLTEILAHALSKVAPRQPASLITLERPKHAQHGDYSCPVAMQLARLLRRNPREVAGELVAALPPSEWLAQAEIAGAGFINLRLHASAKQAVVRSVLAAGSAYGRSGGGNGQPVLVEFVSANPTGPLHVGHGRQAALGDAISALLASRGYGVVREFYYNDAGAQIDSLALSVQARIRGIEPESPGWPEDGYRGDYIREIAADYLAGKTVGAGRVPSITATRDPDDLDTIRRFAVAFLRCEQDADLESFGVRFDNYYLESSLYSEGRVARAVQAMVAAGKSYEREGALWLKTTDYGDDKDRVMRKSDGSYTYFVPDVAYHVTKWERGFRRAINVQGSDHHSTITRVRAGLQAASAASGLNIVPGYPDYVLHKMVTVMKSGEEVRISKRAGSYVTLRDLIDDVGRDATRFFLVSRKADSEFTFDVDLAKSQSEENPVYYIQYAHARVCSVLEQWRAQCPDEARGRDADADFAAIDLSPLTGVREQALLQRLGEFPEALDAAARELAPHQVAFHLRELAGEFHTYYNAERVLVPEIPLRLARIALIVAVRRVLANGLALLGVGAPQKM
ncbi:MAG: arginine--tRNA ligase [Betaproteobacteria bacterium]|nr:arginine--tRNA ligase [Betaproteobacteria bacterium]